MGRANRGRLNGAEEFQSQDGEILNEVEKYGMGWKDTETERKDTEGGRKDTEAGMEKHFCPGH